MRATKILLFRRIALAALILIGTRFSLAQDVSASAPTQMSAWITEKGGGEGEQSYPSTTACNDCCVLPCNMCPCTYGYVEGLIFDRNNQAANRPLVLDANTGAVLQRAGDLDFNWGGGIRAVVGKRIVDCVSLELGYLGIFNQTADATILGTASLQVPGALGSGQVNNFLFADQINLNYSANLHSGEVNLVHCCCDCCEPTCCRSHEWLIGFRNLNLNERFTLTSIDRAEGTTTYVARTHNHLYGGQLGGRIRQCYGSWSWESTAKAGLYGNVSSMNQDPIVDFPGVVVRTARSANDDDAAFVGDLNFTAIRQINEVWGLRAGYNLLWIEGIALAPDQLDFTNNPNSGTALFNHSGVFMHGVSIGLEARW